MRKTLRWDDYAHSFRLCPLKPFHHSQTPRPKHSNSLVCIICMHRQFRKIYLHNVSKLVSKVSKFFFVFFLNRCHMVWYFVSYAMHLIHFLCMCSGFLAVGQDWQSYCKALEFYLQQVAAHPTLCKCKALDSFLINSEVCYKHTHSLIQIQHHSLLYDCSKENTRPVNTFSSNECN